MAKKTSKDLNKNLAETLNEMEVVKETKKVNKKSAPKTSKKVESTIKETITLNIKRLHEDAVIPSYAHDGDIGMDMVATSMEYNEEKDYFEYGTGIAAESERGKAMLLLPRSSVSNTSGYICNSPGLVDPFTYRGEIKFRYKNRESTSAFILACAVRAWHHLNWFQKLRYSFDEVEAAVAYHVKENIIELAPYLVGDKIGQMVMINAPEISINLVDELSETARGEGGFGSSGK